MLFKENQEGMEKQRRVFTDQIREARASAMLVANEHKDSLKVSEKKRKAVQMELASLSTKYDAAERRKVFLQEELARSRDLLSKNKKSSAEMLRLTEKLSILQEQKDAAEASLKSARIACCLLYTSDAADE